MSLKTGFVSLNLAMLMAFSAASPPLAFAAETPEKVNNMSEVKVYVNENYESTSIGSTGSGFTLNKYTNPTGGGVIQKTDGDKVMELKVEQAPLDAGTSAYVEYIYSGLGGINEKTFFEASLTFSKYADVTTKLCLRPQGAASDTNTTFLQFTSNGSVCLYDGKVISGYIPNKEYKISIGVDIPNQTYDVYINGRLRSSGYALQKNLANIAWARIQLGAPPKETLSVFVDDYRIYTSEKKLSDAAFEAAVQGKGDVQVQATTSDSVVNTTVLLYADKPNCSVLGNKGHIDDNSSITPVLTEGQTMVPLRFFANTVGASLEWDGTTSTAVLKKGEKTVLLTNGTNEISVGGVSLQVPVGGRMINGVMMAPISELCDIFDLYLYNDEYGMIAYSPNGNQDLGLGWETKEQQKLMRAVLVTYVFDDHSVEEMMSAVQERYPDHSKPRLIVTDERLEEMKQALADGDPVFTKIYETLKSKADLYLNSLPEDYIPQGYYIDIVSDHRAAMDKIITLSGIYRLTGDERYAARAREELMVSASQPTWNPYHFMPIGECCVGVAIGYDWLYNYLSERDRYLVRSAFVRNAILPALDDIDLKTYWASPTDRRETGLTRTSLWWSREDRNNWDAIISAGYMMCLLTMTDELTGTDLKNTMRVFETYPSFLWRHILTYAPNGESNEGVMYWDFGLEYLAYYDLSTKSALGMDMGISSAPGMSHTYDYFYACVGPVADFVFHDSGGDMYDKAPSLLWCANISGDPGVARNRVVGIMNGKANYRDFLLWTPGISADAEIEGLDAELLFTGNASMKSGMDSDAMFVALHADQTIPGPTHGHADSGTFILQSQGLEWFMETGTVAYSLTDRDNSYRVRPEGHNTVLFNPRGESGHVKSAVAKIDKFESKPRGAWAASDLSAVYADDVESLWRGIKLDNDRTVITVQDEFVAKKPSEFYWFAHTYSDTEIDISEDGKTAILTRAGKQLRADIVHGDGAGFSVMKAEPLPTSTVSPEDPAADNYQKLTIHVENVKEMNLTVVFRDILPGVGTVDFDSTFVPISEWSIEDGEYDASLPKAEAIYVNGEAVAEFDPNGSSFDAYISPEVLQNATITADSSAKVIVEKGEANEESVVWNIIINNESNKKTRAYKLRLVSNQSDEYMDRFTELTPVEIEASDVLETSNPPEHTLDSNYGTRWTGKDKPWICYDLGEVQPLRRVGVALLLGDQRSTRYAVEISKDGKNFERVWIGDDAMTLDLNYTALGGKEARYVRIQFYGVNGNEDSWISMTEFRAYGMMQ